MTEAEYWEDVDAEGRPIEEALVPTVTVTLTVFEVRVLQIILEHPNCWPVHRPGNAGLRRNGAPRTTDEAGATAQHGLTHMLLPAGQLRSGRKPLGAT